MDQKIKKKKKKKKNQNNKNLKAQKKIMETILQILTGIPAMLAKRKQLLASILIILGITIAINHQSINKCVFKKDLVSEFVEKTYQIESSMEFLRGRYKIDEISIAILHNGITAINHPNFHLLKFSVIFSVGPNSRANKVLYTDQPLSLWLEGFQKMLRTGYYVIPDMSKSKDPLVRRLHEAIGKKTQVYLPLYKGGHLIGFCVISYVEETELTRKDVLDMKRSVEDIESKL